MQTGNSAGLSAASNGKLGENGFNPASLNAMNDAEAPMPTFLFTVEEVFEIPERA